jgi:hypothetical protein
MHRPGFSTAERETSYTYWEEREGSSAGQDGLSQCTKRVKKDDGGELRSVEGEGPTAGSLDSCEAATHSALAAA